MDPWFYQEKRVSCIPPKAIWDDCSHDWLLPVRWKSHPVFSLCSLFHGGKQSWKQTSFQTVLRLSSVSCWNSAGDYLGLSLTAGEFDIAGSLWQVTVPLACISELQQSSYVTAGHVRLNAAGSCDPFTESHTLPISCSHAGDVYAVMTTFWMRELIQ